MLLNSEQSQLEQLHRQLYERGNPAWQLVRKRTTVYDRSMPHFHVWIVEEIWRGRAGVVALVRLETNFEYRNAAVRSAPPGSLFRVFLCREEH